MTVWVSGSLAYDRIMDYAGRFADHINIKKLHVLSISFTVPRLRVSFGGTAGNIAYSLRMLSVVTGVVSSIGKDGADYKTRLQRLGADVSCVAESSKLTASAYIITDRADNQITGFVSGAMSLGGFLPRCSQTDLAIVAAETPKNMARLVRYYRQRSVPFIFDPGQSITAFKIGELKYCLKNCWAAIGNDYEIGMILKRSKYRFTSSQILITTLGDAGSQILTAGKLYKIPPARPVKVIDPTGAGDAYRAGLIKGILAGYSWDKIGRLASVTAVYAVEKYGTQNHKFSWTSVTSRYLKNYKELLN